MALKSRSNRKLFVSAHAIKCPRTKTTVITPEKSRSISEKNPMHTSAIYLYTILPRHERPPLPPKFLPGLGKLIEVAKVSLELSSPLHTKAPRPDIRTTRRQWQRIPTSCHMHWPAPCGRGRAKSLLDNQKAGLVYSCLYSTCWKHTRTPGPRARAGGQYGRATGVDAGCECGLRGRTRGSLSCCVKECCMW